MAEKPPAPGAPEKTAPAAPEKTKTSTKGKGKSGKNFELDWKDGNPVVKYSETSDESEEGSSGEKKEKEKEEPKTGDKTTEKKPDAAHDKEKKEAHGDKVTGAAIVSAVEHDKDTPHPAKEHLSHADHGKKAAKSSEGKKFLGIKVGKIWEKVKGPLAVIATGAAARAGVKFLASRALDFGTLGTGAIAGGAVTGAYEGYKAYKAENERVYNMSLYKDALIGYDNMTDMEKVVAITAIEDTLKKNVKYKELEAAKAVEYHARITDLRSRMEIAKKPLLEKDEKANKKIADLKTEQKTISDTLEKGKLPKDEVTKLEAKLVAIKTEIEKVEEEVSADKKNLDKLKLLLKYRAHADNEQLGWGEKWDVKKLLSEFKSERNLKKKYWKIGLHTLKGVALGAAGGAIGAYVFDEFINANLGSHALGDPQFYHGHNAFIDGTQQVADTSHGALNHAQNFASQKAEGLVSWWNSADTSHLTTGWDLNADHAAQASSMSKALWGTGLIFGTGLLVMKGIQSQNEAGRGQDKSFAELAKEITKKQETEEAQKVDKNPAKLITENLKSATLERRLEVLNQIKLEAQYRIEHGGEYLESTPPNLEGYKYEWQQLDILIGGEEQFNRLAKGADEDAEKALGEAWDEMTKELNEQAEPIEKKAAELEPKTEADVESLSVEDADDGGEDDNAAKSEKLKAPEKPEGENKFRDWFETYNKTKEFIAGATKEILEFLKKGEIREAVTKVREAWLEYWKLDITVENLDQKDRQLVQNLTAEIEENVQNLEAEVNVAGEIGVTKPKVEAVSTLEQQAEHEVIGLDTISEFNDYHEMVSLKLIMPLGENEKFVPGSQKLSSLKEFIELKNENGDGFKILAVRGSRKLKEDFMASLNELAINNNPAQFEAFCKEILQRGLDTDRGAQAHAILSKIRRISPGLQKIVDKIPAPTSKRAVNRSRGRKNKK